MNTLQVPESSEQTKTLENILEMSLKICQTLDIEVDEVDFQTLNFNLPTMNLFNLILRKIYNSIIKTQIPLDGDITNTFQSTQQKEAYEHIEDLLQKQQSRNRILLKKQFQYKEYMNSVVEQRDYQKSINMTLKNEISKLQEEVHEKTLEIMHLKNQNKAFQRNIKDYDQIKEKSLTKNKAQIHISSHSYLNGYEISKQLSKIHTAHQRQFSKSQIKKNKQNKQKAIYALYNYHKKNHEALISLTNGEQTKKGSVTQRHTARKSNFKDMNSAELSYKKQAHSRRKSEQCCKRISSQKEARELKQLKKKKDEIISRFNLT